MKQKKNNPLKIGRKILAAIFFTCITLMLLDFTGTLHGIFGWMAKIQFFPAVMAINVTVITFWAVLTLMVGRIYCSTICPLGTWQDIVSAGRGKKGSRRFGFMKECKWLRYGILALVIIAIATGISLAAYLLAPYSNWGRIVADIFQPLYIWGNNLLALISEHFDSYAFYSKDVWMKSICGFGFSLIILIAVSALAWWKGRIWCNTVCPVGSFLGLLSRFSWFKIHIDTDKCVNCGQCGKKCKASCIDTVNHKVDYSRCTDCFDCLDNCSAGAISFSHKNCSSKKENGVDSGRRAFLTGTALVAGAGLFEAKAQKVDGGLAELQDKVAPKRQTPLKPAGSKSLANFSKHCLSCQLCVAQCPNDVLRPSSDLSTFMQPEMSYERGYCRPECTKCSQICPAGAILPVSVEDKSSIQIGHAVWAPENCVPLTDGQECGNCARHCPVGAIKMVRIGDTPYMKEGMDSDLRIPVVNEEKCIGCGACENLCPSRPFSAIYVEGHEVHKIN